MAMASTSRNDLGLDRILGGIRQQLQRDQQEEQAARTLERRQGHAEVVQDLLTERREHDDHTERHQHRLPGRLLADRARLARGQRDEDRHGARRIHDHEQRDKDLAEQRGVEDAVHGR
jgi:hypothetical protein